LDQTKQNQQKIQLRYGLDAGFKSLGQTGSYIEGIQLANFSLTLGVFVFIGIGRLTWLVYIIGAVIGGRVSYSTIDEYDALDGELVCRWVWSCAI